MRLTAYLDGTRVGWFDQRDGGVITLDYDTAWQRAAGRIELSLSLPKSRRHHEGTAPGNYLWNLLPDNVDVLERWARRFSVSARNPLALLANVGLDAAGAVQLVASDMHDEPELSVDGGIEPIDDAGIAAHLRELRKDPTAWVTSDDDGGYFSLAGAQSKFTLVRTEDGSWGLPTGRTGSTHIVKPGVTGLARSDLNEHLTLRAAHFLGLAVAHSSVMRFEEETAIVVTRFDRARAGGGVVRRHQEDFAQATGVHPSAKYQNEGGPGIAVIGAIMREYLGSAAERSVARFFEATLFNWVALGTDAHAKNYALLHVGSRTARPTLAPLYDLGSALAYPQINNRKAKLAMSYDGRYRTFEIEPRHIVREAAKLALTADWIIDRARQLVDGLPDALSRAASEARLTGDDAEFAGLLIDRASERTAELRRQLSRPL